MKRISSRLSFLLLALAFLGQANPPPKTSVAVYPIKAVGAVDKSLTATLASLMTNDLTHSPPLLVIDESMLEEVMKRSAMNISDACDSTFCQVKIGELVQAQKMVVGELSKLGPRWILTLKVIDVRTSALDFSDRVECACPEDQLDWIASAGAKKIREYFGETSIEIPPPPQPAPSSASAKGLGLGTGAPAPGGPAATEVTEVKPTGETRAASGPATLYITTNPPGATVYLSGTEVGKSDPAFQKDFPSGQTVQVVLKKSNYHDLAFNAELKPGIIKYENQKLKPAFGTLKITSEPSGAAVAIAGQEKGNTPYANPQMPSGKYLLSVKLDLYDPVEELIEVKDEATTAKHYPLTAGFGTLAVASDPTGASVLVNGKDSGATPIELKLSPGKYPVKISKDGYLPKEFNVTVAKGQKAAITPAQAKLIMMTGTITVLADPPEPGAKVFLDGIEKGTAPLTLENIPVGNHAVKVKGSKGEKTENMDLKTNETKTVKLDISRPPYKGGSMVFVKDFKFYIDKYEVTNQNYQQCVSAGVCKDNEKYPGFTAPNQPVDGVYQNDARTYCQWAGKRLPKEAEWQEAAQGTDGREYPWGNQTASCQYAVMDDGGNGCGRNHTWDVGSKPAGASPYGALDMAGNTWEWVEEEGVLRGGSWSFDATYLRVSDRLTNCARYRSFNYGFRCARD